MKKTLALLSLAAALAAPLSAQAHRAWLAFREAHARFVSQSYSSGPIRPLIYVVTMESLTVAWINELETQLGEDEAAQAMAIGLQVAGALEVTGVLAVELFEVVIDGERGLLVNELAMRPHNSGHWTMDGAVTGQFEQHLRAVLDYPLGSTAPSAPVTVMANILGAADAPAMSMDERLHHLMARMPEAKVHLYGKGERPDRKIGHVNIVGREGDSPESVRERAERAAQWMSRATWTDGWDEHS